jgi:hypothetical protein
VLASGNVTIRKAHLAAFLLVLSACRKQAGPDENYEKALKLYQQLYGTELDEAYADPKMDTVVTLLKLVNPRSIDAPQAERMLGAITHGKEELVKSREKRAKMSAEAEAQARQPVNIDPAKLLAAYNANAPDAGVAGPGPTGQDPYGPGAVVADINASTGGCLVDGEPFEEEGSGQRGIVYRLSGSQVCHDKLPAFMGQAVLVTGGRIYRRIPDIPPPPPVVRTQPADAGTPRAAPAAPPQ